MAIQLFQNQKIQNLKIKRLGINGEGVSNYKGMTIFVEGALPKEVVDVQIKTVSKRFGFATVLKMKKASKDRVQPFCHLYERCGGCQIQHLSYPAQLEFKKDLLHQALVKFKPKGYETYKLLDTLGMGNPLHYRNKAQFQFGKGKGSVVAGLYAMNSHQLIDLSNCPVQEKSTQQVANTVKEVLNKFGASIYDERRNKGLFKRMMIRVGVMTGEVQLVLITRTNEFPKKEEIISEIKRIHPEIKSIMQNIQPKVSSEIFGEKTILLSGKRAIVERLEELSFDLSARAFFQLNPAQTKILYEEARRAIQVDAEDTLVDAYCGVGTIGLSLAKQVKKILGMDITPQAIEDALVNAKNLGVENTEYVVGKAEEVLPRWVRSGEKITGIIVDPPRTGLDEALIRTILTIQPEKFVYISCNVSTLARDLVEIAKVYDVEYMQSVDMFPHTARCEVVVKLIKRRG
ncbi:MAG: 23S rRNA (uracil(1939)-C(5))-methyltransferase RlmD [Streptococcaceae bacterium]|jgi:23S rRNA (uracil-5-)-methyltransferase RumA|nr:23S rRNA (uracil(1939)-C(5))-methyltransferase RlmD [Streptococcaceae bacterium]